MSRAPRISVIIPTHDRLAMLQQAVASVAAQTIRDWELVIVDDASDDGTWEWSRGQPSLRCVRQDIRRGPAAARNLGAARAEGTLLAFLDSDDLFVPEKLEQQLLLLDAQPELALCHTNEIWLRHGRPLRQHPKHEKRGGWIFEHCLPACRISPSAAVVRREVFERLGGFDEALEVAEDYELWLRLTARYPVGFLSHPLVIKRGGHPDQLSMKHGRIEMFRVDALRRVLIGTPLSPSQRRAALAELRRKCEIVALGCVKRGRAEEAARYRALPDQLEMLTSPCAG